MKMLRYLLAVIAVLGIGFFLVGVFVPKFTYSNSVSINASPAQVWSVFTDESRMSEWMAGYKGMRNLSGKELEVGSQWLLMLEQNGESFEVTETVTHVVPEREFAFTLEADVMVVNVSLYLEPDGEGTMFRAENEVEGKSAAWKSLLWLAKSNMQEQGQANYLALKQAIESG